MIVVDASTVFTAVVDDDRFGNVVRGRLHDETLLAPALVDIEVLSALRRKRIRGEISNARAVLAVDAIGRLPMRRHDHQPFLRRVWELRDNVSAYDAVYIALAEISHATLLTTDARLARAPGIRCDVEVLT